MIDENTSNRQHFKLVRKLEQCTEKARIVSEK
jgi:hypothetical protein